jgi:F0F1-type ATP synthase assembly protein I
VVFFALVKGPRKMGDTRKFQLARIAVLRLSGWQLLLTAALTFAAWFAGYGSTALSVFAGGSIGLLAGLYQAMRLLQVNAAEQPDAFMRGLWVSEAIKIVLTVALFIAAIRLLHVEMVPTIVGYAVTYIVYWIALGTSYPWFETEVAADDVRNLRDRNWPDK